MRSCNPEIVVGGAPGIPTAGPMAVVDSRCTDWRRIRFGTAAANTPTSTAAISQKIRLENHDADRNSDFFIMYFRNVSNGFQRHSTEPDIPDEATRRTEKSW